MSCKFKNYYDILNLKQNCSQDEIKKSFIKLSKKYHPDKNDSTRESHERFIDINEAYTTLNNPLKRRAYDESMYRKNYAQCNMKYNNYSHYNLYRHTPGRTSGSTFRPSNNYYSGTKMNRLRTSRKVVILATFILLTVVGIGIEVSVIRSSWKKRKEIIERNNIVNSLILNHVRETVKKNGKVEQLRRLKEGEPTQYEVYDLVEEFIRENAPKGEQ